ncbi:cobyric acid synthase [Lolliginicoccus suaedae]|uniref:cobyric acid synthase n=1 Tax=Lolliginicoccus suaedae TaxID=2605429 RepID=UPI0011ECB806|nr:cobyric acid synthase [Lolliginicoccus suaedae]
MSSARPSGALLVAGTTSDAGKSLIVAGLCRAWARQGVAVAPFKAQNMSNNSFVTLDGGEIGRAQALQARACGLEPSTRFNPILLKPGSDRRSQLVIHGRAEGMVMAGDYVARRAWLRDVAAETLRGLREEFDIVVCEGAGSPAEMNLRHSDVANMGLAEAADLPVVVVGDIDRGGVLAHFVGTLAVLSAADQQRVAGFIVNKFRGDPELLRPGLESVEELTGRPVLGTVPFLHDVWLDAEDSLASQIGRVVGVAAPPLGGAWLSVAAIRLPRVSNATDVEALACEPGVVVRWVDDPGSVLAADLVVLPGSKATVDDLRWLRERGLDRALRARADAGGPLLGICGGYQMLGRTILDPVESGSPAPVAGLGLLDVVTEFASDKVLERPEGRGSAVGAGISVRGYEIHHGRVTHNGEAPLLHTASGGEGSAREALWGTHWHGLLDNDEFRRAFLVEVARLRGARGFRVSSSTSVAGAREAQLDAIADAVEQGIGLARLEAVMRAGCGSRGEPGSVPVLEARLRWP